MHFFVGADLSTQDVVDMFAYIDWQRLSWYTRNQGLFCLCGSTTSRTQIMADLDNLDLNANWVEVFSTFVFYW